jgi:NAD dependent epimerase/dehydratase family enzyme
MLLPFKLGVGGALGSGKQYLSWISLQDLLGLFEYALMTPTLEGACNATTPHPITNNEFSKALGAALRRPAIIPTPAPVLTLVFGEVADALLLSSSRVVSSVLEKRGYVFTNPTIESALAFELGLFS